MRDKMDFYRAGRLTNFLDIMEAKRTALRESDGSIESQIGAAVLDHNARHAMFTQVLPMILTALEKYDNKPIGEKTREKIQKEMRERFSCSIHINKNYIDLEYFSSWKKGEGYAGVYYYGEAKNGSCKITIYDREWKRYAAERDEHTFLRENRYVSHKPEKIIMDENHEPIRDIPNYVSTLLDLQRQADAAQQEADNTIRKYKRLAEAGIDYNTMRRIDGRL